jgi:hypothetical protein
MDLVLGFQPRERDAIAEMDRQVLESARCAIVRCYREHGVLSTKLDIGSLAGIRALTPPFSMKCITRMVVRSLVIESFNAHWDKSEVHGTRYVVYVDWRVALKCAEKARRDARRRRRSRVMMHQKRCGTPDPQSLPDVECESVSETPSFWTDRDSEIPALDWLGNPLKVKQPVYSSNLAF